MFARATEGIAEPLIHQFQLMSFSICVCVRVHFYLYMYFEKRKNCIVLQQLINEILFPLE